MLALQALSAILKALSQCAYYVPRSMTDCVLRVYQKPCRQTRPKAEITTPCRLRYGTRSKFLLVRIIYLHIHIRIYRKREMCVHLWIYTHICIYICVCVCMYLYTCVYLHFPPSLALSLSLSLCLSLSLSLCICLSLFLSLSLSLSLCLSRSRCHRFSPRLLALSESQHGSQQGLLR